MYVQVVVVDVLDVEAIKRPIVLNRRPMWTTITC